MKTLIVGTGIIGTVYGWALSEAGNDVTHFVRPGKAANYRTGVQMDMLDERKGYKKQSIATYLLKCVEDVSPEDGYELVIVPTNMHQLEEAIRTLAPRAGQAGFLTFTLNWDDFDFMKELLPPERYIIGYPDGGGTVREGVYWSNLGAEPHIGALHPEANDLLERVRSLFESAGMKPDVQPNILHWLWLHVASTAPFIAGFAKYRQIDSLLRDRDLLRECYAASREVIELCRRRGVEVEQYPEMGSFNLPGWLFTIVFKMLYATNPSMKRYTAHAASKDSLLEGKGHFQGMLNTAHELGSPAPHLERLGGYLQNV